MTNVSIESLDPEIAAARQRQAESVRPFDVTKLPSHEGRALANEAALFFNDGSPAVHDVEELGVPRPYGAMRARLYRPLSKKTGAILYIHGGGWFHCNVDTHDRVMRLLALQSGHAVLGIDYRLSPEHPHPAAYDDARAAWSWLRDHAASLALDPQRVAIAGDSAGANLALSVAIAQSEPGGTMPIALALFYGCFAPRFDTDSHRRLGDGRFGLTSARMRWYWKNYIGGDLAMAPATAVPLNARLEELPPTYLSLATLDPLSDDTRTLAVRLAEAGVPCSLAEWPGAGHGFLQMTRDAEIARRALSDSAAFLAKTLR